MMKALQQPHVHIHDMKRVESLINNMVRDGDSQLQVIADFDRTLSGYMRDGKHVDTCHQALDHSGLLPEHYREKAVNTRNKYYPIEIDPNRTMSEKIPYMVEWWKKAHDLLVSCHFTKSTLKQIVSDSNVTLRDGSVTMFEDLAQSHVPLLIFSAGVGDVIEEVLVQQAKFHDNMKIVSNYMDFNAEGKLVGFKGDVIHVFNKNKSALHKSDYFDKIKSRGNLILLGDSVGDLNMAEGAHDVKNLLKIGFLNDHIDRKLPEYTSKYDIVLVSDETMDIPRAILSQIL